MRRRNSSAGAAPIRVLRIIARLNIGGPAIQAITLTRRLEDFGYATTLVRGKEEPDEGNMDHLARELEVAPVLVPTLRRNPGWRDLRALLALAALMRRQRPTIVHTHAAKGGTLGRAAAVLAFPRRRSRPLLVHTYHGHSLTGYFSPRKAAFYRRIEVALARFTDSLIAVSPEVRDELIAMGVAQPEKFEVVRLGFDLSPLVADPATQLAARERFRAQFAIAQSARVVTLVARLVPIKRVDRFLRIAASLAGVPDIRFLIVGDGELREALQASKTARSLNGLLAWTGFRHDMPDVYFASDVVVQTSDNEGTPVSLIEAQAAGRPVVSTRVGGTPAVVEHWLTGFLVEPDDESAFAAAIRELLADPEKARKLGDEGRKRTMSLFGIERLVRDHAGLYDSLIRSKPTLTTKESSWLLPQT